MTPRPAAHDGDDAPSENTASGGARVASRPVAMMVTFLHAVGGGGLIVLGALAIVLPGPFTVPPVVLGLWVLSRRFPAAAKLLARLEPSWHRLCERYRDNRGRLLIEAALSILWIAVVMWTAQRLQLTTRLLEWIGR